MKSACSLALRSSLAALLCFTMCVLVSISSHSQTCPSTAQPLVNKLTESMGACVSTPTQTFLDATQFSSASGVAPGGTCMTALQVLTDDMAGRIQAAICNLPQNGGTVDARGFGDPVAYSQLVATFGSNPFADPTVTNGTAVTTKNVTVLLPARVIKVDAVIGIPKQSLLKGQGSLTTFLQLDSSFPGYGSNSEQPNNCGPYFLTTGPHCYPVICMGLNGDSTSKDYAPLINVPGVGNSCENPTSTNPTDGHLVNNPRVQVESLGIDLNPVNGTGTAYGVAIQNITAQEKSWVKNVQITDIGNGGRGINIAATGRQTGTGANEAQNSGPYTDLEINWAAPDCTITTFSNLTYGIFVQNSPSVTIGSGGHITINGNLPAMHSCSSPTSNLVAVDASGAGVIVENLHVEKWHDAVQLGANADTFGTRAANITDVSNVFNAVEISNNHTVTGVVSSVESMGTNTITDNQSSFTSATSTSRSLSSYLIGPGLQPNNFVAHGNSVIDTISSYKGVATAGIGVPAVYGASGYGGWPTFTFFVKVGTARSAVTAFLCRREYLEDLII